MSNKTAKKERPVRVLNADGTVNSTRPWNRTVCASDLKRYLQCPAMYLLRREREEEVGATVSEEIGEIVHEESVKPAAERTVDLTSRITTVTDPQQLARVAAEARVMINTSVKAQEADSSAAKASRKEHTMVHYDAYTDTRWYAKPDSMDLTNDGRGDYLKVVDQKAGRYRSKQHMMGAFFFGYVAKMTQALGHSGTVRYVVRYLRDWNGNVMDEPDEFGKWLGHRLTEEQDMLLYGIQATIKLIDKDWQAGRFATRQGEQCSKCPFRESCPGARAWMAEQEQAEELDDQELVAQAMQLRAKLEAIREHNKQPDAEVIPLTALVAAQHVNSVNVQALSRTH